LAKYLGASIAGTLVHYAFLIVLVRWFTVRPLWASTSGAIIGALVIYLINYFITFHSTRRHINASSRFIVVAAVCTAVNALILNTALTQMDWSLAPAQVFATGIQFSIGFAIHRVWTF
jgi:putative flippase GtrA